MTSTKQELELKFRPILKRLNGFSNDIEASAIMTRDGLSIASVMNENVNPDRLGAMCASLLSLGDKTASELERGKLKQVLIECESGSILIVNIGKSAVLAIVAKATSKIGMVFVEARKAATEISETNLI
jgi:predicted regulator of Ras-like GTPase activity (Roadblock/LC7/MglB family)